MKSIKRSLAEAEEAKKPDPWFTIITVNTEGAEHQYEDVTDYSMGGGYLGMKFKDGSMSYVSLELHRLTDINVEIVNG